MPVWLWYCVRARSFWFFTAADPSLTFGGFEGEGKQEMYEQLPPGTYPETVYIEPGTDWITVKEQILQNNFSYPFVAKPDVGMMGFMFRIIYNEEQLQLYHAKMPIKFLIQKFVDYENEYALFYYRLPNTTKGTISGLLSKSPPKIMGDGKSDIATLIENNPDLKFKIDEMQSKHKEQLKRVLPKGETFVLSQASNRSQGGKLTNLSHQIDAELTQRFDALSLYTQHFYYGRYDIKCDSLEDLKQGKNFSILEFNGTGAGVQHVYGDNLSLFSACKVILKHWHKLFQIAMINHRNGVEFWEHKAGRKFLREAKKNLHRLKQLDADFPDFTGA